MSRMCVVLAASFACAALALACQQDSGLDIVRVPQSAYSSPDAARPSLPVTKDAGTEAGAFMVCIDAPPSTDDDKDETSEEAKPEVEMSSDFADCPLKYEGRPLDPRTTQRHRDKDNERACCYRPKGTRPQPVRGSSGED